MKLDNSVIKDSIWSNLDLTFDEKGIARFILDRRDESDLTCIVYQRELCGVSGKSRSWVRRRLSSLRIKKVLVGIPFKDIGERFIKKQYWFLEDLDKARQVAISWRNPNKRLKAVKSMECIPIVLGSQSGHVKSSKKTKAYTCFFSKTDPQY